MVQAILPAVINKIVSNGGGGILVCNLLMSQKGSLLVLIPASQKDFAPPVIISRFCFVSFYGANRYCTYPTYFNGVPLLRKWEKKLGFFFLHFSHISVCLGNRPHDLAFVCLYPPSYTICRYHLFFSPFFFVS